RRDPGNDTHGLLREKNVTVFSPAPATTKLGVRQYLDRAGREVDALELAARHEAETRATKPMDWLSGDQNTVSAESVPERARTSSEPSSRMRPRDLPPAIPTNARFLQLGEAPKKS